MKPKLHPGYLIYSMILFAVGTLLAVLIFVSAYATQLAYGNDKCIAHKLHIVAYVAVLLSIVAFVGGIVLAAVGFCQLP
jgi:hypothetical protein